MTVADTANVCRAFTVYLAGGYERLCICFYSSHSSPRVGADLYAPPART